MLKGIVRRTFKYDVSERKMPLFSRLYKNSLGLNLFGFYSFLGILIVVFIIGFYQSIMNWNNPWSHPLLWRSMFLFSGLFFFIELIVTDKNLKNPYTHVSSFIYKQLVSFFMNGKVISSDDWMKIQDEDSILYRELLEEDIPYQFRAAYSISKIISNIAVSWCAIIDPMNPYAGYQRHVCLYRNGYVYDLNLHQNISCEDYIHLYEGKIFKTFYASKHNSSSICLMEREYDNWIKDITTTK